MQNIQIVRAWSGLLGTVICVSPILQLWFSKEYKKCSKTDTKTIVNCS